MQHSPHENRRVILRCSVYVYIHLLQGNLKVVGVSMTNSFKYWKELAIEIDDNQNKTQKLWENLANWLEITRKQFSLCPFRVIPGLNTERWREQTNSEVQQHLWKQWYEGDAVWQAVWQRTQFPLACFKDPLSPVIEGEGGVVHPQLDSSMTLRGLPRPRHRPTSFTGPAQICDIGVTLWRWTSLVRNAPPPAPGGTPPYRDTDLGHYHQTPSFMARHPLRDCSPRATLCSHAPCPTDAKLPPPPIFLPELELFQLIPAYFQFIADARNRHLFSLGGVIHHQQEPI